MRDIFTIGLLKTIYFNLKHLPFRQAVRFPILVARNVSVNDCKSAEFEFMAGVRFRLATIGFARQANKGAPSALHLNGKVIIRGLGVHSFGAGCCVTVKEGAVLDVGDNFLCTGETTINVEKSITIGDNNLWSYNNMVMDNDGHKIYDSEGMRINEPREVVFGNHIWMGCGCIVLKGSMIADNNIIAAGSTIKGKITAQNSVVTTDGKVLKENISWKA